MTYESVPALGLAYGVICTALDSYALQVYTNQVDRVIAQMEAVSGIGMILCPVLGNSLHELVGFTWTFQICGATMGIAAIVSLLLPQVQEAQRTQTDATGQALEEDSEESELLEIGDFAVDGAVA